MYQLASGPGRLEPEDSKSRRRQVILDKKSFSIAAPFR